MEEDNRTKLMGILFVFSLVSTVVMSLMVFLFATYYDYVLIYFNTLISDLTASGLMSNLWSTFFETFVNNTKLFINIFDYLWVASFIFLVYEILHEAYLSKRDGYLSIFTFLSYGVLIFLFLSSILNQLTQYIYDFFFGNMLVNIASSLTFFTFYINNYMIVNLIIILLSILINFVDFDLLKFKSQKQKELLNDEI